MYNSNPTYMYRAYIIEKDYRRSFQSVWFKQESSAEAALIQEYKRRGLDPEDPNVFGSGVEEDEV
jgi:hypothetical protein